jgi:hypothetical protein
MSGDQNSIRTICERGVADDPHDRKLGSSAPSAFTISPIADLKNCRTRPQEGKVIATGNQKAKIDQFKRSFP